MKITIVFPVLNEELRLENGITTLIKFMNDYKAIQYTITIVDNGSTDQTCKIAKKICSTYDNVTYIRIEERGVGAAFRTAVKNNNCEIIGYMDIDLSTELAAFIKMYYSFKQDSELDIVNASRYSKDSILLGRKWYRNFISYTLIGILKATFHMKATDAICGFKFFRRECIEELLSISSDERGWFLLIESKR